MSKRARLLRSLADAVSDYRAGELARRTPELILQWLQQFPAAMRDALLEALVNVFEKTYISRTDFKRFLSILAVSEKVSQNRDPADFWREANILDIQQGGNSQREILVLFDEVLRETHGFGVHDTGSEGGEFVYLDDCVGTGSRARSDVCAWLESTAPERAVLHVITPVLYAGSWWIDAKIQETAAESGKELSLTKWRLDTFQMENRRAHRNASDVLWPTTIPDDPDVQAYARHLRDLGHPAVLRNPGSPGASGIFQDDREKVLLEEAFLIRGCQIRRECVNLPDNARPLGYHNLDCFGFGSMFVTYRNCPNNCPLALWVEQSEYPALFPRRTN